MFRIALITATFLVLCSAVFPNAAPANDQTVIIGMDNRFSGFDAIGHIKRNHGSLAAQAESISHWAAYFSVNPVLLTHVAKARYEVELLDSSAIRSLAKSLASLKIVEDEAAHDEDLTRQALHEGLSSTFGFSPVSATRVLDLSRKETVAAGLNIVLTEASATPPALDLPFSRPQAWQFNGVHTWTGDDNDSAMSSIDFVRDWSIDWGDDTSEDWISAAHDGQVSVYSSCYMQILHDSGWATVYYHMDNLQVKTGQSVTAGEAIGNYAKDRDQALCSGGKSTGPHLHFALQRDGQHYSLQDIALSGYIIHPGTSSYDTARSRMWLEKRATRYFAFDEAIAQEEGDNTIDYRYNGMWYSPDHDGHGLNIEISEFPQGDSPRKSVFIVMYTYDDFGLANFYAGSRDYDRWRSDESMTVELLQTSGGDLTNLLPIDFSDPEHVESSGALTVRFLDCQNAEIDYGLKERSSGQVVNHSISLTRLIGVPEHVCEAASLDVPAN